MQTLPRRDAVQPARVLSIEPPAIDVEPTHRRAGLTMAHVAIVIVADSVSGDLQPVLDQLAPSMMGSAGAVLLDVDGCTDATVEAAHLWARSRANVRVVRPGNFGHGGNRKFCFRWAIERGHSIVVFLDTPGAFAAARLEPLVGPLLHGAADAVLGLSVPAKSGRVEGFPYDLIGRHADPLAQLLRRRPTRTTSGRAYNLHRLDIGAVEALTDGPAFDTELVRHLLARGRRVLRIERPNN